MDHSFVIFKLLRDSELAEIEDSGVFRGSADDLRDGFIHLSTRDQVRGTAAKHFSKESDLFILAVDSRPLGDDLRWEPSRGGASFPHLYAPLPKSAVIWIRPLPLGPDGLHAFPDLSA